MALLDGCAALRSGPKPPKFSRARDLLELDERWQVRLVCFSVFPAVCRQWRPASMPGSCLFGELTNQPHCRAFFLCVFLGGEC